MSSLPAPAGPKPVKESRVPRRVRHAVDLLVSGRARTQKEAAHQAGITPEHLSRALAKPHVQAYRRQRADRALDDLRVASLGTLAHLLRSADSEHVRKDIALRVLAAQLEPERGPVVSVNVTPGYVLDLSASPDATTDASARAGPVIDGDAAEVVEVVEAAEDQDGEDQDDSDDEYEDDDGAHAGA